MANQLRQRICRAIVGTVQVDNLDMTFTVTKSIKREPNTLELVIFNLTAKSQAAMAQKGAKVQLLAGYLGDEVQQIFSGDVRHVTSRLEDTDWQTKITSGDGEKTQKYDHVNASFPPGASMGDILKSVAGSMDVQPGNLDDAVADLSSESYASGYTASGRAANELDRLTAKKGMTWSIQDGELQILKGKTANRKETVKLDSTSGLIGTPEVVTPQNEKDTGGVKVRSLLRGVFQPGGTVVVASTKVNGNFRIEKVTHKGDTAGQDWYSDLELQPL